MTPCTDRQLVGMYIDGLMLGVRVGKVLKEVDTELLARLIDLSITKSLQKARRSGEVKEDTLMPTTR